MHIIGQYINKGICPETIIRMLLTVSNHTQQKQFII